MNDDERYLFDLMGYLVVDDVLSAEELAGLNRLVDQRDPWGAQEREQRGRVGEPLSLRGLLHAPEHRHTVPMHPQRTCQRQIQVPLP